MKPVPRLELLLLATFLAVFAAAMLRNAAVRPLWYDEVFTAHLSRPAELPRLLGHLAAGVDLNPPLLYVATAASLAVFGESEWSLRLPAVLGGVLAAGCLYLFGRFRGGPVGGFVATTAGLMNRDIWAPYFYEARPYGLMIGLAAAALLGWQRATAADGRPRRGWLTLLAGSVVLGVATHYFFVLVVAGLVIGEAVRTVVRRRIDWLVIACFAVGGLTVLALAPLWNGPSREYAGQFWAKPRLDAFDAWELYAGLTGATPRLVIAAAAAAALAAHVLYAVALRKSPPLPPRQTPLAELAALAAWAAGPVTLYVLGATVTGVFHPRYTVALLSGAGMLVGLAVARLAGPARWGVWAAAAAFAAAGPAGRGWAEYAELAERRAEVERTVADLRDRTAGRRVVVETTSDFAEVWYYGGARGVRPVYVVDFERRKKYQLSTTVEVGLTRLARATPVPLVTLAELDAAVRGGEDVRIFLHGNSWLTQELLADGYRWEGVDAPPDDTPETFRASLGRLVRGP